MPDSKQLRVLKALVSLLEQINPTEVDPAFALVDLPPQNYGIDLRGKVFRGKTVIGQDVKLPAVAILESPTPIASLHAGEEGEEKWEDWRLLFQGFALNDMQNPTDPAYDLKAQVEVKLNEVIAVDQRRGKPLFPESFLLGNLIGGLTIGQGVVRPPEEKVSATAFFYIPVVVKLATTTRNPYG